MVPLLSGAAARQRGGALLALMLLFLAVLLGTFFGRLNSATGMRERSTSEALTQARDALIGVAATYRDNHENQGFGYLPCPDTDNDGVSDPPCGTSDAASLGRFPWKTLDMPPLRDRSGECLWYAVAGRAKNNPKTNELNWDTLGQFIISDMDGATLHGTAAHARPLAVVLAPGPPLLGQERRNIARGSECRGTNSPEEYLENLDSQWRTERYTGDIRIILSTNSPRQNAVHNDQGIWIDPSELFERIKQRSDFKTDIDTLMNDLVAYLDALDPTQFPATSLENKGIDPLIQGYLARDPLPLKKTQVSHWRDQLLYAKGNADTFKINGKDPACRALLIFSGERTVTQRRSTVAERNAPAMYLEGDNARLFPGGGNYAGASEYQSSQSTTDIVRCIHGRSATAPSS